MLRTIHKGLGPGLIPGYEDKQKYKYACYMLWVRNLVAHIEGGT
jgi:hypothetical protein